MGRELRPRGADHRRIVSDESALIGPGSCLSSEDASGIAAVVVGAPWWQDSRLAGTLRERGAANSIVAAYRDHGADFLEKLRGEFAVAVVEQRAKRVLLAVDRFGIQRLCFARTSDALAFASNLDAVRCFPGVSASIDPQAIFDYLYFHMIPSPRTIYAGIHKLEPGHLALVDESGCVTRPYWSPHFSATSAPREDLERSLLTTLDAAVSRSTGDDPRSSGAFLSGGLDSSTVAGLLARQSNGRARAYSIGFSQQGYDEMEFARIAARHFDIDLHEYYVEPQDVAATIPLVSASYDEPFGNSSAVPAYFCARMARDDGRTRLLAGDGGDELFAGNERYARQLVFDIYCRLPAWLRQRVLEPLFVNGPVGNWSAPTRKIRSYIEQANVPMPLRLQSYNFLQREQATDILHSDFLASVDAGFPASELGRVWDRADADTLLNRMLFLDWKFTLADNDLRKVNGMCQLAGIEVAYPMLDDELTDFSLSVPSSRKLRRYRLRHFFKEAMRDFLPQEVLTKSKHGFGLPFGEWLKTSSELQDLVYGSLGQFKRRSIVRDSFIDDLIATHRQGHASYYGEFVWILTMLEQWFASRENGARAHS